MQILAFKKENLTEVQVHVCFNTSNPVMLYKHSFIKTNNNLLGRQNTSQHCKSYNHILVNSITKTTDI